MDVRRSGRLSGWSKCVVRMLLVAFLATSAIAGHAARPASAAVDATCVAPAMPAGIAEDRALLDGLIAAQAGNLSSAAGDQCAGASLLYQSGVDESAVADYHDGLALAFPYLKEVSGMVPAQRVTVLVFSDAEARERAVERLVPAAAATATVHDAAPHLAPAFVAGGKVWIDASRHDSRAERLDAVIHEITHLFVAASPGYPVPLWLDEGLAVYNALSLQATLSPAYTGKQAAEYRRHVLDALAGKGPRSPVPLVSLTTEDDWNAQYRSPAERSLQYAQAYSTVRWLVERYGEAAVWALLRESAPARTQRITWTGSQPAAAIDFEQAFARAFGLPLDAFEATIWTEWENALACAVSTVHLTVGLPPSSVRPDTWLSVWTSIGGQWRRVHAGNVPAGSYTFTVTDDGTIVDTGRRLRLQTLDVDPLPEGMLLVQAGNITYRTAGGAERDGMAVAAYSATYGEWAPQSSGWLYFPEGSDQPEIVPYGELDASVDGSSVHAPFAEVRPLA